MTITIHSHQRSGTMFILNNLARLLDMAGHNPGIHKSLLVGIENPDNFRVAVLRNPVDTIVSTYAHTKIFRKSPNIDFNIEYLKTFVQQYVDHLLTLEKYSDEMVLYKFEDLEKIVLDIASKFVTVPENFSFKMNEDAENNPVTVRGSTVYENIISGIEDHSVFAPAFEVYDRLIKKASIIV